MLSGNKGEWSEIYVFLKLLADGRLYAADENLGKIENIFYPILSIRRNDSSGEMHFARDAENSIIKITDSLTDQILSQVPTTDFSNASQKLLSAIQSSKGSAFSVPEIEEFLRSINVHSIKARSQDKRDITLAVHDSKTGMTQELGFSIKSNLGNPSTLLNPGTTTNFIYEIHGGAFSETEINSVNSITTKSKVRDRLNAIFNSGRTVQYKETESRNFKLNLQMIDTFMPEVVAKLLVYFYEGRANRTKDLIELLESDNPLGFDVLLSHPLYEYKVKTLLTDIALGMTPASAWQGVYDATGGYIIVREDGEILCYHIYNRNEFQNYLVNNTRLDTPSTTRYNFASIFTDASSKQFFKLNLQIRFL